MLGRLMRKPVAAAIMRAGKPGWDRPDVPVNQRYEIRRRIGIQARAFWVTDSMQPQYLLTNPEVLLYEWKDRYVLAIYVATYLVLRITSHRGSMTSLQYFFRSRINSSIQNAGNENHSTGLNIPPEQVGAMVPNVKFKEYLEKANNSTSHTRKINNQIRDSVRKIVEQAKHHASHQTKSGDSHSHDSHHH